MSLPVEAHGWRCSCSTAGRRGGAVGEPMAEVGAAVGADRLLADHAVAECRCWISTTSSPTVSKKTGQPEPDSNLVSLLNSAVSHTTQR